MSNPQASSHQLLFIAGLHRSGTSIIHDCLRRHPRISGFHQTGVPEDEGQHLQTVFPPATAFGGLGRFGFHPESHLTETSPLASPEHRQKLWGQWSEHWDLSKPVLIEKSPPNLLRTRYLQACFEHVSFLMVTRHPIATAYATRAVTRGRWHYWMPGAIGRQLEHWFHCQDLFEMDRPQLQRVCDVRYETFVDDAQGQIDRVTDFVGLPRMRCEVAIRQDTNDKYFAQWQRDLARPGRGRKLGRAAEQYEHKANRYGYTLVDCNLENRGLVRQQAINNDQ